MDKKAADFWLGIILLIFLLSVLYQIKDVPDVSKGYPIVLLTVAIIMTLGMVIKNRAGLKMKIKIREDMVIIFKYSLLIIAYLAAMNFIGYIASTFIFMMLSLVYLNFKKKLYAIVISFVTVVMVYSVFTHILNVILPKSIF